MTNRPQMTRRVGLCALLLAGWLACAAARGQETFSLPGGRTEISGVPWTPEPLWGGDKAVYGTDDRIDVYAETDAARREWAASVCALVYSGDLTPAGTNQWKLSLYEFQAMGLMPCDSEPFRFQPAAAFCTGFLVGPDLVATAGHCFAEGDQKNTRFVFGFNMINANTPADTFSADQVYSCAEVVGWARNNPTGMDYCVLRLDRPVSLPGVWPFEIRRGGAPAPGTPVGVIGHAAGLPKKIAFGGATRTAAVYDNHFMTNTDSYGGNSGSPVINAETGVVEGILVRGYADFFNNNNCFNSMVYNDAQAGEEACKASLIAQYVPEIMNRRGEIVLDKTAYKCQDTVRITLRDKNAAGTVTAVVTVNGPPASDTETVTLSAVPSTPGIFTGSIPLVSGTGAGDGKTQAAEGDTITVSYSDINDGAGHAHLATARAAVDCTPPGFTGAPSVTASSTGARIVFGTTESALPSAAAGTSCGVSTATARSTRAGTEHALSLGGLQPGTKYYYRVTAQDAAGNSATDNNQGACYEFTTTTAGTGCDNPLVIQTGEPVSASTTGVEGGAQWFSWTPGAAGIASVSLCDAADFDTSLTVFDRCGGAVVAANDDYCGLTSRVEFSPAPGASYIIRVSGYGSETGHFELDTALVRAEDYSVLSFFKPASLGENHAAAALARLGMEDVYEADNAAAFLMMLPLRDWELVLVDVAEGDNDKSVFDALAAHHDRGGRIILYHWLLSYAMPQALLERAGVTVSGYYNTPLSVRSWERSPLFIWPNSVPSITGLTPHGTIAGHWLGTTTAAAHAGYTSAPAAGKCAVTMDAGGRFILNGFSPQNAAGDTDTDSDGTADMVELYENEIMNLLHPPSATLRVNLSPAEAVAAGVRWRRTGTEAWMRSGATLTKLPPVTVGLEFLSAGSWIAPETQSIVMAEGESRVVEAVFTPAPPMSGAVRVTITPAGAAAAGARWRVAGGGAWYAGGQTAPGVAPGTHTVEFSSVSGWFAPAPMQVTVASAITTSVSAAYTPDPGALGSITVVIGPTAAASAGAKWRISGATEWREDGYTETGLYPGSHWIDFTGVPGWLGPWNAIVSVEPGRNTRYRAVYTLDSSSLGAVTVEIEPEAAAAGAKWRIDGTEEWLADRHVEGGLSLGQLTVQFSDVPGWVTPEQRTITITARRTIYVTAGYVRIQQTLASVRVNVTSELAVMAGAKWRRLGTYTWRAPGTGDYNLPPGACTIEFADAVGWVRPADKEVALTAGETTTVDAVFTPTSSAKSGLNVMITPPEAVEAGARWRRTGAAWRESGSVEQPLVPGSCTVEFINIAGWTRPANMPATLSPGVVTVLNAAYVSNAQLYGAVRVSVTPPEAVAAGAKWRRSGTSVWRAPESTETDVAPGTHTIEFSEVSGWTKPSGKSVVVTAGATAETSAAYTQIAQTKGILTVVLLPAEAAAGGAKWRRTGTETWRAGGEQETGVAPGNHAVEFSEVYGWTKPAGMAAAVRAGETTTLTAAYTASLRDRGSLRVVLGPAGAESAGAGWRRAGTDTWRAGGATETALMPGAHTVEFTELEGWVRPADASVQIAAQKTTEVSAAWLSPEEAARALLDAFGGADADGGGALEPGEARTVLPTLGNGVFALLDGNGDGVVSEAELRALTGGEPDGGCAGCPGGKSFLPGDWFLLGLGMTVLTVFHRRK